MCVLRKPSPATFQVKVQGHCAFASFSQAVALRGLRRAGLCRNYLFSSIENRPGMMREARIDANDSAVSALIVENGQFWPYDQLGAAIRCRHCISSPDQVESPPETVGFRALTQTRPQTPTQDWTGRVARTESLPFRPQLCARKIIPKKSAATPTVTNPPTNVKRPTHNVTRQELFCRKSPGQAPRKKTLKSRCV